MTEGRGVPFDRDGGAPAHALIAAFDRAAEAQDRRRGLRIAYTWGTWRGTEDGDLTETGSTASRLQSVAEPEKCGSVKTCGGAQAAPGAAVRIRGASTRSLLGQPIHQAVTVLDEAEWTPPQQEAVQVEAARPIGLGAATAPIVFADSSSAVLAGAIVD